MKEEMMQILENEPIAKNTYEMVLQGDISEIKMPGQFVNLALPGFFLRRPISVCDAAGDRLTLIYKVVGHGTEEMAKLLPGARLSVLTGLGRGFAAAVFSLQSAAEKGRVRLRCARVQYSRGGILCGAVPAARCPRGPYDGGRQRRRKGLCHGGA